MNIAVIGFGFMGITHAMNVLRNKRLTLQAIITREVSGVEDKINAKTGNIPTGEVDVGTLKSTARYTSLEHCLKHEHIDAVIICVHADLHFTIAKEAMEQGLHVFLEKPLSLREEEAQLLIYSARHQKIKFMVGHVVRFIPAYKALKGWIDQKNFGALQFISLTRFSGVPSWGQWNEKKGEFGSSGGALFDLVIHDIDFLNYTLGVPDKIQSSCQSGVLSMHDYVTANWFYGDVQAKIEGGNTFHSKFPFHAGYMARFETASVMYSSLTPGSIQVATDDRLYEVETGDPALGFYNEIDYFTSCIENDTCPLECTPESSLQTIQLCYNHT